MTKKKRGNAMRKKKERKNILSRIQIGKHGGCEALLYEFRERLPPRSAKLASQEPADLLDPHITRIAATTFEEAAAYLRWDNPGFVVEGASCLGLITLVSGSPVD